VEGAADAGFVLVEGLLERIEHVVLLVWQHHLVIDQHRLELEVHQAEVDARIDRERLAGLLIGRRDLDMVGPVNALGGLGFPRVGNPDRLAQQLAVEGDPVRRFVGARISDSLQLGYVLALGNPAHLEDPARLVEERAVGAGPANESHRVDHFRIAQDFVWGELRRRVLFVAHLHRYVVLGKRSENDLALAGGHGGGVRNRWQVLNHVLRRYERH